MIRSLSDFAPAGVEAGTGLALQDEAGRYLFFLAGTRHKFLPQGELFFAGIGGHLEPGEDWQECAHREALEETGTDVELLPAAATWHLSHTGAVTPVDVAREELRPLALYEMIHPPGSPRAGELYRIVIYRGRLLGKPTNLPPDEVRGVIAITEEQLAKAAAGKPTLAELLNGGAAVVAGCEEIDPQMRLYPIGTAAALARILSGRREQVITAGAYVWTGERFVFEMGLTPRGDRLAVVRLGGHVEAGESPRDCAIREIQEEAGVTVTLVRPPLSCRVRWNRAIPMIVPDGPHPAGGGVPPILVIPRHGEPSVLMHMYLARAHGAPRPTEQVRGLLLLRPMDLLRICEGPVTLAGCLSEGAEALLRTPVDPHLCLELGLQARLLARLLKQKGDALLRAVAGDTMGE